MSISKLAKHLNHWMIVYVISGYLICMTIELTLFKSGIEPGVVMVIIGLTGLSTQKLFNRLAKWGL